MKIRKELLEQEKISYAMEHIELPEGGVDCRGSALTLTATFCMMPSATSGKNRSTWSITTSC